MMRRLTGMILLGIALLPAAVPVLAQGDNPLEHSILLADFVGWLLAGLAVLLMALFILWTKRAPDKK